MTKRFTLLVLFAVFCFTPAYAQIQWAGTGVIDLDAETLSLGAFTSWTNNGTGGGTFSLYLPSAAPTVVSLNKGTNAVDKKAVMFANPLWSDYNAQCVSWSNTAASLFGGVASNFSIEAWIYDEDYTVYEGFATFASRYGGGNWVGFWTGGPQDGIADVRFLWGEPIGTLNLTSEERQSPPTGGVFNHFVFTYNVTTGETIAYINGKAVENLTLAPGFAVSNIAPNPVVLGACARVSDAYMGLNGGLAKVRVHTGVLTPEQVLNNFDFESGDYVAFSAPVFVDTAVDLQGVQGGSFSYTAAFASTPLPPPDWSLVGEPVGMVIDPLTGEITWSPVVGAVDDTYSFTVHAENTYGFDDLDVTLTVIAAPARYEAEDAVLLPVLTGLVADVNASGGQRVAKQSQTGVGDLMTFTVNVPTHGMYNMVMGYYQPWGGNRDTYVKVNGVADPDPIAGPTVAAPDYGVSAPKPVALNAGDNTIVLYNDLDWGPHWDYIEIPSVPYAEFFTITASAGPDGTISPSGPVTVVEGENQTFTMTPDIGFGVEDVLVDSVSQGSIDSYEFTDVADDHEISVTFVELPKSTVSGTITDGSNPIPGAVIYFNIVPNASSNPTFIMETEPDGTYEGPVPAGTWYLCASADSCLTSADLAPLVLSGGTPQLGVDFVLEPNDRNIPAKDDLLFAVVTEAFAGLADGAPTGPWPLLHPLGPSLTTIGSPTVEELAPIKWEHNVYGTESDGLRFSSYTTPIAADGATIVVVVKPVNAAVGGEPRGEIVDIFYNFLWLATNHTTGEVIICRGQYQARNTGYIIPDGQKTILSLVVQSNGYYKLYANGNEVYSWDTDTFDMTSWVTVTADGAPGEPWKNAISVGRNVWDGWSTYNGNIGDVFVYTTALSDPDRQTLETDLADKFGITGLPATPTPMANTPTPKPPTTGINDWSMFE